MFNEHHKKIHQQLGKAKTNILKSTGMVLVLPCLLLLTACTTTTQSSVLKDSSPSIEPTAAQYQLISERSLNADGPNQGLTAYQLIRNFAGKNAIESPDIYANNHPGEPHIFEASDEIVGNHFVFVIHKDIDKDRDVSHIKDRQRNEIKAYGGSPEELKAYQNQVFTYSWKFKINQDMSFSKNFGHLFQLKAVDDGPGAPLLTISGRDRGKGKQELEVIHRIHGKTQFLSQIPLKPMKGRWLQVKVFVNYKDHGQLNLQISDVETGQVWLNLVKKDIDMWRGQNSGDFVRPKWGIYRSLRSKEMLRSDEEQVYFADFVVQRLQDKVLTNNVSR